MGAIAVETLMAALYTDHALRRAFVSDPSPILDHYDLTEEERASLLSIDMPGLILAGNSFAYKRWRANQWRHTRAYTFTSYDEIFSESDIAPARDLFSRRFDANDLLSKKSLKKKKLQSTHAGIVSELLPVLPGNQLNHEHVLMENQALAPVARIWQRLFDLNLRDHFLIRLYFFRATSEGLGIPETLHPRPGACITYIPLCPVGEEKARGYVTSLMVDGRVITKEPLQAGTVITFPADVAQRIECADGNESLSQTIDLLCVKSLCAAV